MSSDPLIDYLKRRTRRRFARLVRETHRQILDAAYRVVGDRDLAEDVTQEVFLKLLTVRWNPGRIRSGSALLASTAVLAALMRVRADRCRAVREEESVARKAATETTASIDEVLDLREAILALPDALQACVRLRYYGGLSAKEIAAELECSTSTVNERLSQARQVLQKRLRPTAWLLLLPAFSREAGASLPTLEPSPTLCAVLSRLGREGIPALSIISSAGAAAGAAKLALAAAVVLLAAICTLWATRSAGIQSTAVRLNLAPSVKVLRAVGPPTAPPERRARSIVVHLEGDGDGWPPTSIPVRFVGDAFEKAMASVGGSSIEVQLPPGTYRIEADGRPDWTRESSEVTMDGGDTPREVTLRLQDHFELEGHIRSSDGADVVCEVHILDRSGEPLNLGEYGEFLHPPAAFFTETLRLRDRCEIIAIPQLSDLRSRRVRIENPEGLCRIQETIVLDASSAPLGGMLVGCGMTPVERRTDGGVTEIYARPAAGGHAPVDLREVRIDLEDDLPGSFLIRNVPGEPFVLHAHCPGYLPQELQLDPAHLPDPLVLVLDCDETFHGSVEPPNPRDFRDPTTPERDPVWSQRWIIETEGGGRQTHDWIADADGNFVVHGKDLRKASFLLKGQGFEDLAFEISRPTSPDHPAVLRPVAIPDARVEVTVDGRTPLPDGTVVVLQPIRSQDWSNILASHERDLTGGKAVFEDVLPARYDVIVTGPDGEPLANLQDQSIRGPRASVHVHLTSNLRKIELKGTAATESDALVIRLDDDIQGQSVPCRDGIAEIIALPGWHLVEVRDGKEEVIYRGQLLLSEDEPRALDFSRLITLEVTRNSADAPRALSMYVGSREDELRVVRVALPLPDHPGKSVHRWLEEASTHSPTLIGQYGYYYLDPGARRLGIGVGLLKTLRVPIMEDRSVRTFLLGKVPGQAMVYWYGCNRPVAPGAIFEVPLECDLSEWALLLFDGQIQNGTIANGVLLEKRAVSINVSRADGSPVSGAEVSIRGKEVLGLDLNRYFRSRSIFFTLGVAKTDADGKAEVTVSAYPAMDLKVVSGGSTVLDVLPPDASEISVQLGSGGE